MLREIGSDFWEIPSHCNDQFQIAGIGHIANKQLYVSGRSAIRAFCRQIGENKKILIPMYTCETVIAPFEKEGWSISFYAIKRNLKPDLEDLRGKIEQYIPDAILVHSYFGFNTLDAIDDLLYICKEKGIIVLEDITQSLLSDFIKTGADYYVGSLRKFFAIPEGGVLLSASQELQSNSREPVSQIVELAKEAFSHKKAYMEEDDVRKEDFLAEYSIWKQCFVQYDDIYEMSEISQEIMRYMDVRDIKKKRRENYLFLYDNLKSIKEIEYVLGIPTEQEVPLYFPVYIKDKLERKPIQSYLADKNIYCPIIWPQYVSSDWIGSESKYVYEHILCIPIDQRYGQEEMLYIIKSLEKLSF